jgi:uncharacterized protein YjbI with pentapeptide repeats
MALSGKVNLLPMQRLSFDDSWKWLRDNTNLTGNEMSPPAKIGPAGYGKPESWIDVFKDYDISGDEDTPPKKREIWKLEDLTMPGVFFCRCGIIRISFRNTSLAASSLTWNDFTDVEFTNADLSRCDLRSSLFKNVRFVKTDLREADLRLSSFENCDFTGADMTGTKLTVSQGRELPLSEAQRQQIAWKRGNGSPPRGG